MIIRNSLAIAAMVAIVASGPISDAKADVSISGSTTVAGSVLVPYKDKIEEIAGMSIEINAIGSSRGIRALVQGKSDLGAISAPLASVVRKINKKKPGSVDGRSLIAHPIGSNSAAFIVNQSNPVKRLSLKQITDILAGRIQFWSEVGGNSVKIEIMTTQKGGGIRSLVEKKLGKWGDVMTTTNEVQTGPQVVFAVTQVPQALGISTAAHLNSKVYALDTDKTIRQPLFLITKGEPDARLQQVIDAVQSLTQGVEGSQS